MRELKFSFKKAKIVPFDFVLDALSSKMPTTKPMFGCTGVYVDGKIIFILRDRKRPVCDDGVWICTSSEHHESLRKIFSNMRSISVFETKKPTGWQILAADTDDFEESVLTACELVLRGDPRIGRLPT
ncbi:MAG: hypothetical protein KDD38_10145, partial [Bdellovibrionales bacterium]|nr:hypothetical protein [Bdellovibrionales bacterium]